MFGFGRKPKVVEEEKSWTLDAPGAELFALFGAPVPMEGEEPAGPESALRVPAVLAAVRVISETIASLDIRVKREGEVDADHPVNDLLWRPNPWTSAVAFKRDLVMDAVRHGVGYAVAVRADGKVRELHRVTPGSMVREVNRDTGEPRYRYTSPAGGERFYTWQDVIEIQPVAGDGERAASLLTLARDSISFAANLNRHGRRLFANGARPGGILKFSGKLSPTSAERWRAAIEAQTRGAGAGRSLVLGDDADWKPLSFTSTDAQFLELWRFVVLEIARVFRVPPHMLADLERTTHSNAEEMNLQFVSLCLRPWCELITGAFQRVVFSEDEQRSHWLDFDYGDLLRPNTLQLFEAVTKAVGGPTLTPNEGRAVGHGLGPIPDGDKLNQPQGVGNTPAPAPKPAGPDLRVVS